MVARPLPRPSPPSSSSDVLLWYAPPLLQAIFPFKLDEFQLRALEALGKP
jgi:hypothetical protein